MKTITKGAIIGAALLLASNIHTFAIEGLTISVQCPNVILGWPSNPGENYIVQWRPTLDPSTPWVTLTNSLPADWTTNWTFFVHSNVFQCPTGGTNNISGGGGDGPPPTPSMVSSLASPSLTSELLAMPADGSGSAGATLHLPAGIRPFSFHYPRPLDRGMGERLRICCEPACVKWPAIRWPATDGRLRQSTRPRVLRSR
jgi:hypothetical protein